MSKMKYASRLCTEDLREIDEWPPEFYGHLGEENAEGRVLNHWHLLPGGKLPSNTLFNAI